jgi:hypothetical protein
MVNSEELIGTIEYLMLWTRCRINRCRYNRVRLCLRLKLPFVRGYECLIATSIQV